MDVLAPFEPQIIVKIEVPDVEQAADWYTKHLGFEVEPSFQTPNWVQLSSPPFPNIVFGLSSPPNNPGSGGECTTFVISDIEGAREALVARGVQVGPIENVGDGVQLAFFDDPYTNRWGLRQNPD
jgi:predicted enzyme related to lactoylglutathione lyase